VGKGSSSPSQETRCWVVGYRYSVGLHHVLCQSGPAVLRIELGGRTVWSGAAADGSLAIDQPYLFGGDEREGGVVGTIQLLSGAASQAAPLYLAQRVGRTTGGQYGQISLLVQHGGAGGSVGVTVRGELRDKQRTLTASTSGTNQVPVGSSSRLDVVDDIELDAPTDAAVTLWSSTGAVLAVIDAGDTYAEVGYGGQSHAPSSSMPAFRCVLSALWQRVQHSANNPYLKAVRYQVQRSGTTSNWYAAKAAMSDGAMNPAHILHELLTDGTWGLGLPSADLDLSSFTAAADTLAAEDLGLDLLWQDGSIQDLMQVVLDHCEGRLYQSPATGLWTLELLRADYTVSALPLLDASVIVSVESYERRGWDEVANQVVVEYIDRDTGQAATVSAQNLAAISIQGGVVSETRRYPGIGSAARAARVAERDLRVLSRPLAALRLRVLRDLWALGPGDAVRVSWPEYGIAQLVCRVAEVDAGTLTDGIISVALIEDAFGVPVSSYLAPQSPAWEDPTSEPQACPHTALMEAPYWVVARSLSAATLAALIEDYGFVLCFGARPSGAEYDYQIYSDDGAGYTARARAGFTMTSELAAPMSPSETQMVLSDVLGVSAGTWALIGDAVTGELVAITDVDGVLVTVDRGVLDTVPQSHAVGARVWVGGAGHGQEGVERVALDIVDVKMVPRTGLGPVPIADIDADSIELANRASRPYPPGNVALNGEAYPAAALTGDLVITWSHRDRTQQTAYLVAQSETDIGPEPGTTYTVTIYDADTDTQLRQWTALETTTQTYTQTQRETDMAGVGPHNLRIEISAHRDSLESWQTQTRACEIA
jgi:hypothetical protein